LLEVEPSWLAWPDVTEMGMKLSPVPLQKHSLGGCTIDIPRRNAIVEGMSFRFTVIC